MVMKTDIAQDLLDGASAELGPQGLALLADVTQLADMERVYAEVHERFGRPETRSWPTPASGTARSWVSGT